MDTSSRIQALEDREEIERLRHQYCYRMDAGDIEELADLFTEDGEVDFGPMGTAQGRDEIAAFLGGMTDQFEFLAHMVHNPIVDVEGDTATGRWYVEVPAVTIDGVAQWIQGSYDESYRRTDFGWKIDRTELSISYVADYEDGWADELVD